MRVKIKEWKDLIKSGSSYYATKYFRKHELKMGTIYPPPGSFAQFLGHSSYLCGTIQEVVGTNIMGGGRIKGCSQSIEDWMIDNS